jgi:enoyl-CoA hydratase
MTSPIRLERDGDVAEIVIHAPPVNAFGREMFDAGDAVFAELEAAPPRAAIVRAEGDVFSAGADVAIFEELDGEADAAALLEQTIAFAHRWEALPFPTVALVQGLCLTAGMEFALLCDMLWAADEARFGLVEATIGITPLMCGTERVCERAGAARARELVMSAGIYDAQRMYDWGVVNRVLPAGELLEKGRRFAARLAAGPTVAHGVTKRVVRAAADEGSRAADARLAELAPGLFATEDVRTGLTSFREHGPGQAVFSGR